VFAGQRKAQQQTHEALIQQLICVGRQGRQCMLLDFAQQVLFSKLGEPAQIKLYSRFLLAMNFANIFDTCDGLLPPVAMNLADSTFFSTSNNYSSLAMDSCPR